MELRDIEYFAVVAEHGHLGRAAEALGLSQPALSKSLRRLERILAAKLVNRTSKGVELTAEGSALLVSARTLSLSLRDITREIAELGQGRVGHLRIGTGPLIRERLLMKACTTLLKDSPKTTLNIIVTDNDVMVPALRNGELDIIVNINGPTPFEGLVQERLYDDEFIVFASANHRLAALERVTLADLTQERWALSAHTITAQHFLDRAFQVAGLSLPRVALETRAVRLRLLTIATSDLLDFTSRRVFEEASERFGLKELPVKELRWSRPFGMIYRRDAYLSPATKRFIEILKATAKEIATENQ